jgi:hypothetical protein
MPTGPGIGRAAALHENWHSFLVFVISEDLMDET